MFKTRCQGLERSLASQSNCSKFKHQSSNKVQTLHPNKYIERSVLFKKLLKLPRLLKSRSCADRLFHSFTIRSAKKYFRTSTRQWLCMSLYLWPQLYHGLCWREWINQWLYSIQNTIQWVFISPKYILIFYALKSGLV